MSTIQPHSLTKRRVFFRYWLPWLIIGLAGLAILAIWWLPGEGFARANRVVGSIMIGLLGGLLVSLWFLFLSALRWWVRLSFVLAVAGAGFLLTRVIRDFKFTGDMVPRGRSCRFFNFCGVTGVAQQGRKRVDQLIHTKSASIRNLRFKHFKLQFVD